MTYLELHEFLEELTNEQLKKKVVVRDQTSKMVCGMVKAEEKNNVVSILDKDHPILFTD